MIIEVGNMWDAWDAADLFLFTSNGVLDPQGRLVMGGGIAKEVRDNFPGVDKALGGVIAKTPFDKDAGAHRYGLLVSEKWPSAKLGAFQTKLHYRTKSPMPLVVEATVKLADWCKEHPNAQVHLNWPGVGLGGLTYQQTLPLLKRLPHSVHIWTFDTWWERHKGVFDPQNPEHQVIIADLTNLCDGDVDDFFPEGIVELHLED